jgi:hypothetical protein
MNTTLLSAGLACVMAAVIGGGLSAFGITIPVLSRPRQVLLFVLGIAILALPRILPFQNDDPNATSAAGLVESQASETPAAVAPPQQPADNPPSSALAQPEETTTVCQFKSGVMAGQTADFAGLPGAVPAKIGTVCADGLESYGIAVAAAGRTFSSRCKFEFGPRAGQVVDYSPRPRLLVGSGCIDGLASSGHVVP